MTLRFRKPEPIPTLALIVVVAVTCWLGLWQLQRLGEKTRLLAGIEAAQSIAPRNLAEYAPGELEKDEWHNVFAKGTLLNDKELHFTPRYLKGILGYAVLTPFAYTTPEGTRYVLINRGWVPPEKKDAARRETGNPSGIVAIEGAIRSSRTKGSGFEKGTFRPENDIVKNLWYWYDLQAMRKQTGVELLPVIIDAAAMRMDDGSEIKDGPRPFPIEIKIRNDHMGYAITWFMIGLSAIGVFAAYYREKKST